MKSVYILYDLFSNKFLLENVSGTSLIFRYLLPFAADDLESTTIVISKNKVLQSEVEKLGCIFHLIDEDFVKDNLLLELQKKLENIVFDYLFILNIENFFVGLSDIKNIKNKMIALNSHACLAGYSVNHENGQLFAFDDSVIDIDLLYCFSYLYYTNNNFIKNKFSHCYNVMSVEKLYKIKNYQDYLFVKKIVEHNIKINNNFFDSLKLQLTDIVNCKEIKAIVFDFDGVFTEDDVWINEKGEEMVRCSRSDGMGISILKELNLPILILTSEKAHCAYERSKKLNIECIFSSKNKFDSLTNWCNEKNISLSSVVYCGNDINDACLLNKVGVFIAPQNSASIIKEHCDLLLPYYGGKGFIRNFCELFYYSFYSENKIKTCKNNYIINNYEQRPWGNYKVLSVGIDYCTKVIRVLGGQSLSYQYHKFRFEKWYIISGCGEVVLQDKVFKVNTGDIVFIKPFEVHSIKNIEEKNELIFVEIQTGENLDENDIVRIKDEYGRI